MLIYLDMCCLKRPFDDQTQPRVRLESEAVLGLMSRESEALQFVRSEALVLENSYNPIKDRAARVHQWLSQISVRPVDRVALEMRCVELISLGLKTFDALHVGSAELVQADIFGTVDDRLLGAAMRHRNRLRIRVASILEVVREFGQ